VGGAGGDAIEIFESGLRLDVVEPSDMGLGAGARGINVDVFVGLVYIGIWFLILTITYFSISIRM
jgi:hypothetical protein